MTLAIGWPHDGGETVRACPWARRLGSLGASLCEFSRPSSPRADPQSMKRAGIEQAIQASTESRMARSNAA